jgi:VIT1/CCC1 family predicted Fe2+/Mn2+ transporter
LIDSVFTIQESEPLTHRLRQLLDAFARPRLTREDWIGALAVFLLVFVAIFPLVVPFILVENEQLAMRISNATGICLMFLGGLSFGRFTGSHSWRAGLVMVALGLAVVGIAVLLGA